MRHCDTIEDGRLEEENSSYLADSGRGLASSQEGGMRGESERGLQKDMSEKDWDLKDDRNDSGLELVATRLLHHPMPSTTLKMESDSDLPSARMQSPSKHTLPGSTSSSNLKRALPSHLQRSKGSKDNELAEAWLTANIAKNERKRKQDEREQERLAGSFSRNWK